MPKGVNTKSTSSNPSIKDPCDSVLSDVVNKAMDKKVTRTTEELFGKAEELGVDPFIILLHIADGNKMALDLEDGKDIPIPAGLRALAARECMKFLHPTLKSSELTGPGGTALPPLAVRVLFGTAETEV